MVRFIVSSIVRYIISFPYTHNEKSEREIEWEGCIMRPYLSNLNRGNNGCTRLTHSTSMQMAALMFHMQIIDVRVVNMGVNFFF